MTATPDTPAAVSPDSVDTAYCFLHQKERVYAHSTMEWQRDDIECAISAYADSMSPALYAALSAGNAGFLHDHARFHDDLRQALHTLEGMMAER